MDMSTVRIDIKSNQTAHTMAKHVNYNGQALLLLSLVLFSCLVIPALIQGNNYAYFFQEITMFIIMFNLFYQC
jgi:hypothetical protein